ncbi:MAG: hypothetical protein ThorAB25_21730 [Candidatus Thorarchaeota archaeon AB_25]|nr:MAG: hypothetical protein ThorAB25_21730 [Candidatus Thorarchaeota archaeon AB_25]
MSSREQEIAKIAKMYTKYLNGPLGRGVMDHLKEGESFKIRSQNEMVEIIKREGKAVVKILESPTTEANNDTDRLSNLH